MSRTVGYVDVVGELVFRINEERLCIAHWDKQGLRYLEPLIKSSQKRKRPKNRHRRNLCTAMKNDAVIPSSTAPLAD